MNHLATDVEPAPTSRPGRPPPQAGCPPALPGDSGPPPAVTGHGCPHPRQAPRQAPRQVPPATRPPRPHHGPRRYTRAASSADARSAKLTGSSSLNTELQQVMEHRANIRTESTATRSDDDQTHNHSNESETKS